MEDRWEGLSAWWNKVDLLDELVSGVSFEFFLRTRRKRPNGGAVILVRALLIALVLYLIAVGLRSVTKGSGVFHDSIPWFGAIFAAMYVGLYARFSAQWSYLANLYNQIKGAEIRTLASLVEKDPSDKHVHDAMRKLAEWKAAFVEDAEALHLSTKKSIAPIILFWLEEEPIRRAYLATTPDGKKRYEALKAAVQKEVMRLGGVLKYEQLSEAAKTSQTHKIE